VSDTNATPFRRFPWVQLVFCIACLTMTTWTWMRYSYAWEVDVKTIADYDTSGSMTRPGSRRFDHRFLSIRGTVVALRPALPMITATGDISQISSAKFIRLADPADENATVSILTEAHGGLTVGSVEACIGRHVACDGRMMLKLESDWVLVEIDATASRFTGASIAGLVVGAMGCFIFGLYLRAWLRERKALASQPMQDMIV
jgi:hypothetical protein